MSDLPQTVTRAELGGNKLVFSPMAGQFGDDYATFMFRVNDGIDDSASAYTMTVDVNAASSHIELFSNTGETVSGSTYQVGNASGKNATQGFHTGDHNGGYRAVQPSTIFQI